MKRDFYCNLNMFVFGISCLCIKGRVSRIVRCSLTLGLGRFAVLPVRCGVEA